mmetsp:Transcript_44487/g.72562  ORF Transcript_44487/g.72562 Transcript_44487/m.72562 type:complete len:203 (-) Transcript_44487:477-1085(-)
MPERHRLLFSGLFVHSGDLLSPRSALKCCRQQLNSCSPAKTFVASHVIAGATNRGKCACALYKVLQDPLCISADVSIFINNLARWGWFSLPLVSLNFASLVYRCCTVNHKWKWLVGWNAESHRVGTQHGFHTKCWGNGWPSISSSESHHSSISGHGCVVTSNAVMGAVFDGYKAYTMLLCLFNCHIHCIRADIKPKAEVPIQ